MKTVLNVTLPDSNPLDFIAHVNPIAASGNITGSRGIAAFERGWIPVRDIVIVPGARHNPGHALARLPVSQALKRLNICVEPTLIGIHCLIFLDKSPYQIPYS